MASHLQDAGGEAEQPRSSSGSVLPAKRKADAPPSEDHKVVWPPVVIIENTMTGWDAERKVWKSLENEEIRRFLKGVKDLQYGRVIALYGAKGNRGKSLVVFPATPLGYMDAQALCECLESERRGRADWHRVCHGRGPFHGNSEGLATPDGKRILYGYLATERDMQDADFKKKVVKRWSVESYVEKVLLPLKRIEIEKEELKRKTAELVEEEKEKRLAVEQNRSELGKATAEFWKINEEVQQQKLKEQESEERHQREILERKRYHEEEKLKKINEFRARENEIREQLEKNKQNQKADVADYEAKTQRIKDNINEEQKKHQVRLAEQQQMEAMKLMKLDSMLQAMMEERLALLEKKFQEKQLLLQERHNEEIKKSRKAIAVEREKLLEKKIEELGVIEKEVIEAKATSQQIQNECIVCFAEFGKEAKERALFKACGHANLCPGCAKDVLDDAKQKKKPLLCPTCKTEQQTKYELLPAKIFTD